MRAVIRFAEELKLKPIILGASEGWKIASLLKTEGRAGDS